MEWYVLIRIYLLQNIASKFSADSKKTKPHPSKPKAVNESLRAFGNEFQLHVLQEAQSDRVISRAQDPAIGAVTTLTHHDGAPDEQARCPRSST
ncbi:unnamed protein product [Trichogramma brassicae]|uniref:Uncharacterized protein n=1 Tax=Trichogramma brassicae TaxID=86971 RepID=A0A6H5J2M7_9HYME|nr:unnamed protein product [Trichogramma brassicae]